MKIIQFNLKKIDEVRKNKTTLIVSHDYSLLKKADKILKLEAGRITNFDQISTAEKCGQYF